MARELKYPKRKGICLDVWNAADKLLYAGKYVTAQSVVDYLGVCPIRHKNSIGVDLSNWRKYHGLDKIGKY